MKRFCSIVQSYFPLDVRVRKQCEALVANGYHVTVICLRNKNKPVHEKVNGVSVHRVNLTKKRGSKVRYLFEYLAFFVLSFIKLNQISLKQHFDIIQVNNLPDFLIFVAFLQKFRGTRIILDMHEIMPEFYMSKYKKDDRCLVIRCLMMLEKLSLKYADDVITINDIAKRLFNYRSIPERHITVIMNTVNDSIFEKKIKNYDSILNFVYHGYLDRMYGLDIAIEAMKNLAKNRNNFKFYIFGYGPQREYLEKLINKYGIENHVFLMGLVPHHEMLQHLSNMNIGILPIRKDMFTDLSFSNKLGEYVCFKIPVISSNLESTKFYFSEKEITYFNSEDPVDLKNKISFAFENLNIMQEKADNAFKKYKSIKWSVMEKKYLNLIKSSNQ